MEKNDSRLSAFACHFTGWNVCRKAGTRTFLRGRVESGFNYYKAKWKSLYRACTFYYVGISSAVSSDFQRKEKRMAGVSGYSLCFSGFPAHF